MAAAFNLTAQLNLQGPSNVKAVVSSIKKQVNDAKISLNLDVGTDAAKNISSITRRLNNLSKAAVQANSNVATLGSTLSSLSSSFNTASSAANANAASVARTSQSVASAGKAIQQTRTNIEEFGKQAGLAVKRFAAFSTVTAPIYALTNAITSGFKEFVNFNKEIVRLSQVTGQSVSDLNNISKEITRLSTGLGVASSDLLQVATTLAQAGLSAEDTKVALEALAKSALAPSFESLTDTTEGAIAAMRQFGIQTRELDGALGSINAVAAAFAVEASDIITAIQRTGGVFSAASRGVSEGTDALNEFIAIFTSIRATTRESAETIATGLRTIFTRIQRPKTIEQLREFGIELRDTEGKFVGLYEATRRLSEGLAKIDPRSAEFATISEELGGFRQIGKVIPLIQEFAVAEQALSVAQKGTKSTSKDALVAQQSLAVQFEKTRQNFLALIREIGESSSFKAFVGVSLTLADAFINLGRALKPLLPLLLTYASIKAGGAIKEFGSGFGGVFGFGGGGLGGGGGTGTGGPGGSGGGSGGANQSANITALTNNTNTLTIVSQALTSLNQSILTLNQNVVYSNSLALNRPTRGFATGGLVPGVGNSDTVGAMLTPGEFVIRKKAVESIGAHNLAAMNSGGEVQRFEGGSPGGIRVPSGKGRGKKVRKGARGKFEHLTQSQLESLSTKEMIDYAKRQMYHIMTTGGSGMAIGKEFVEVPKSRIDPELEQDLITLPDGRRGFYREKIAPFGAEKVAKSKKSEQQQRREKFFRTSRDLLTAAMQGIMAPGSALPKAQQDAISPFLEMVTGDYGLGLSATPRLKSEEPPTVSAASAVLASLADPLAQFRKSGGKTSLAGVIPKEVADKIRAAIPGYIESLQKENEKQKVGKARTALKYFDSFIGGGTTDVPGQATAFTETINQIIKNNLVRFASGGSVQKFANGGVSKEIMDKASVAGSYEKYIKQNMQDVLAMDGGGNYLNFGMVGLIPGTKDASNREVLKEIPNTNKIARVQVGFLQGEGFKEQIEGDITKNLESVIDQTSKAFSFKLGTPISKPLKKQVLDGAVLSSAAGSIFESALQVVGAPFIDKIESIKSMDFPFGLGPAAKLFGDTFPDNIPSDATRTIAGKGKGISDFVSQIGRFLKSVDEDKFTKELGPLGVSSATELADRVVGAIGTPQGLILNRILAQFKLPQATPFGMSDKKKIAYAKSITRALSRTPAAMPVLERYFATGEVQENNLGGLIQRFADGGGISSEDTVPALLTPGEFVFNKKAAQRIGYGTLNKLNKADKIQGFNKGGTVGVQRFAGGGAVEAIGGPAAAIAALTSILLPQFEKLASSMSNLNGQTNSLAAGFSGAIRESASLVLSTAGALRGLGVDKRTSALTQAAVGTVGAVTGFITEKTAKDLEKALLQNSDLFSKFDKNLQDLTQAPTDELRIEAASRLEKSFMDLDKSVQNSVDSINTLEQTKNISESFANINISVITSISAMNALSNALAGVTFAAKRKIVEQNRALASALPPGVPGPALPIPALGIFTKFLAVFGKLIPFVGLAITVFSIATEVIKFFSSTAKKSGEQLDKLGKALSETTKNSNANSLANQQFVDNVLPEFRKLKDAFKGDPEGLKKALVQTGRPGDLNELNLTFKTALRSRFAQQGFVFKETESLADFEKYMKSSAAKSKVFNEVFTKLVADFEKAQFIEGRVAQDSSITRDAAEAEYNALKKNIEGQNRINKVIADRTGAEIAALLSSRALADANNKIIISLLSLDNVLAGLTSRVNKATEDTVNSFDDLDLELSSLKGEPQQIGGRYFKRNINVLENLGAITNPEELKQITGVAGGLLGIPGYGETKGTFGPLGQQEQKNQQKFRELEAQIEASRLIQTKVPTILTEFQSRKPEERTENALRSALSDTLGKSLEQIPGIDKNVVGQIISELAAKVMIAQKDTSKGPVSFADVSRELPSLVGSMKTMDNATKFFKTTFEGAAKVADLMAEKMKQIIDVEDNLIEIRKNRQQLELQTSLDLRKSRGETISLKEMNDLIYSSIKPLTENLGGEIIPQAGTTDARMIGEQLIKSEQEARRLREEIRKAEQEGGTATTQQSADLLKQDTIIKRLTTALKGLAGATDTVRNAIEKEAEARNKSKSQRDFLFSALKEARTNPEALNERIRAVASIQAAKAANEGKGGFANASQAELFYEQGSKILSDFGADQKEIELLKIKALEYIVKLTPPGDPRRQEALMRLSIGRKQLTESDKGITEAEKRINAANDELSKALDRQKSALVESAKIFENYNVRLRAAMGEVVTNIEQIGAEIPREDAARVTDSSRVTPENIRRRLQSLSVPMDKAIIESLPKQIYEPGLDGAPGQLTQEGYSLERIADQILPRFNNIMKNLDKNPEQTIVELDAFLKEISALILQSGSTGTLPKDLAELRMEVASLKKELEITPDKSKEILDPGYRFRPSAEVAARLNKLSKVNLIAKDLRVMERFNNPNPGVGADDATMILDQLQARVKSLMDATFVRFPTVYKEYEALMQEVVAIKQQVEQEKKAFETKKQTQRSMPGAPTTSTPSGTPSAPRGKQVDMVMEGGIVTSINGKPVKLSPQDQKTVDSVRGIGAGGDGSPSIPPGSIPTIPQQRTGAAPSQLDSGSIQKFENGATVFAKSLTEAPLQNLTDSLNSFNTTSQQLAASLEAFRNEFREGMKGQISYDGDVRVSFTDTLAVNVPKTNNTSLVDMISMALRPVIAAEVDKGIQKNA